MEQLPVSSSPVKRGENLTDKQRQFLLNKIEIYKDPLTDKRNDLQTIHRKKHAWEQITNDFNSQFQNLPRKRSIQQIQTWYKNEKARCRRVLMRQRQRQQTQALPRRGLEVRINGAPAALQVEDTMEDSNAPEIMEVENDAAPGYKNCDNSMNELQLSAKSAYSTESNGLDLKTTAPQCVSEPIPSSNPTATSSLLEASSREEQSTASSQMPKIPIITSPSAFLSFIQDHNRDKEQGFNVSNLTLHSRSNITQTCASPVEHAMTEKSKPKTHITLFPTKKSVTESGDDDEEFDQLALGPYTNRKLFDKKMNILAIKEECIRKYYQKKESVLSIKEQYYKLKLQILRSQILAAQATQCNSNATK